MTEAPQNSSASDAGVTVKITDNGPLLVRGTCVISDQDGNVLSAGDADSIVALCRCGESSTKPMCDGAHKGIFDGTLNPPAS